MARWGRSEAGRLETGSELRGAADGPDSARAGDLREIDFVIAPERILRLLLIVTTLLVVISTAGQAMVEYARDFPLRDWIANLFYVDSEQNLPTMYSTLLLLTGSLLAGLIGMVHRRDHRPHTRHWAALSLILTLLAIDELLSLHEQSIDPLRRLLNIRGGPLWFTWVLLGAALVAVVGLAFLRFLRSLPRSTQRRLWTAGILFVIGAIGMELVGGWYAANGSPDMGYVLIATVEESLEMLGAVVLVYALLAYIEESFRNTVWRFRVSDARNPRPQGTGRP